VALPAYFDLNILKLRLGLSASTYDAILTGFAAGAVASINLYLGFDPTVEPITEYRSTRGTRTIALKRWPITAITAVYEDRQGYYGQSPTAFAATSLLTPGVDYVWALDDANGVGLLTRVNRYWPANMEAGYGRLAHTITDCPGCVKIVYAVDSSGVVAAATDAIYAESMAKWFSRTGIGAVLSDSMDGASVGIQMLPPRPASADDSADNFVSPLTANFLRQWRASRLVV